MVNRYLPRLLRDPVSTPSSPSWTTSLWAVLRTSVWTALFLAESTAYAQELTNADSADAAQLVRFLDPTGLITVPLTILLSVLALRFVNRLTENVGQRFSDRRLIAQQFNTVIRFIIYITAITVVVSSSFTLEQEAILALGGVIAVTVGFALKDLASSVLAGITILFDRPFQVGDRVTIADHYGEIVAIGLRSVRMVTLDDSLVTIPNNRFLTEVVISGNAGALDMQVVMDFYVAVDSDIVKAKRIVYEAAQTSRFVYLEKPVVVLVSDVIEAHYFATRLRVKAYVLDVKYERAFASDVTERAKAAFREQHIGPPAVLVATAAAAAATGPTAGSATGPSATAVVAAGQQRPEPTGPAV